MPLSVFLFIRAAVVNLTSKGDAIRASHETITFYWIEARREVIILCDNFTPGVLKKSVERQLDTAELLLWDTTFVANGSKIEAYSPLHLGIMQCNIEFNKQDIVVFSYVE